MLNPDSESRYIPGTCNIGKDEIRRRKRIGYLGVITAILCIIMIELVHPSRIWKLVFVLPSAIAFTGFLQAYHRFCLTYGFLGVFSIEGLRTIHSVRDPAAISEDRKMALRLVLEVGIGSGILTVLYYISPYISSLLY